MKLAIVPEILQKLATVVAEVAACARLEVRLVGGSVRDLLLGHPSFDFDCVVAGDASAFAFKVAEKIGGEVKTFPQFYTAKIKGVTAFGEIAEVDFVTARAESYASPGALPTVRPGSFDEDILRRDFTINALAIPLVSLASNFPVEAVIDQVGGLNDLAARKLRTLHSKSFWDDPTRIFRGCRYAARIGGDWEERTHGELLQAVRQNVIMTISHTRVLNELRKIAAEKAPGAALSMINACGILCQRPLYDSAKIGEIIESANRIPGVVNASFDGDPFDVLLRIFYATLAVPAQLQMAHAWQFGKRQLAAIQRDLSAHTPMIELTDAGVLYQAITNSSSHVIAELHRRGLA